MPRGQRSKAHSISWTASRVLSLSRFDHGSQTEAKKIKEKYADQAGPSAAFEATPEFWGTSGRGIAVNHLFSEVGNSHYGGSDRLVATPICEVIRTRKSESFDLRFLAVRSPTDVDHRITCGQGPKSHCVLPRSGHQESRRPELYTTPVLETSDQPSFSTYIFTSLRDGNRPHRIVGQPLVTANDVGH